MKKSEPPADLVLIEVPTGGNIERNCAYAKAVTESVLASGRVPIMANVLNPEACAAGGLERIEAALFDKVLFVRVYDDRGVSRQTRERLARIHGNTPIVTHWQLGGEWATTVYETGPELVQRALAGQPVVITTRERPELGDPFELVAGPGVFAECEVTGFVGGLGLDDERQVVLHLTREPRVPPQARPESWQEYDEMFARELARLEAAGVAFDSRFGMRPWVEYDVDADHQVRLKVEVLGRDENDWAICDGFTCELTSDGDLVGRLWAPTVDEINAWLEWRTCTPHTSEPPVEVVGLAEVATAQESVAYNVPSAPSVGVYGDPCVYFTADGFPSSMDGARVDVWPSSVRQDAELPVDVPPRDPGLSELKAMLDDQVNQGFCEVQPGEREGERTYVLAAPTTVEFDDDLVVEYGIPGESNEEE